MIFNTYSSLTQMGNRANQVRSSSAVKPGDGRPRRDKSLLVTGNVFSRFPAQKLGTQSEASPCVSGSRTTSEF